MADDRHKTEYFDTDFAQEVSVMLAQVGIKAAWLVVGIWFLTPSDQNGTSWIKSGPNQVSSMMRKEPHVLRYRAIRPDTLYSGEPVPSGIIPDTIEVRYEKYADITNLKPWDPERFWRAGDFQRTVDQFGEFIWGWHVVENFPSIIGYDHPREWHLLETTTGLFYVSENDLNTAGMMVPRKYRDGQEWTVDSHRDHGAIRSIISVSSVEFDGLEYPLVRTAYAAFPGAYWDYEWAIGLGPFRMNSTVHLIPFDTSGQSFPVVYELVEVRMLPPD